MTTSGRSRVVISIYDDMDNPYYGGGGPAVARRIAGALRADYDVVVITAGWKLHLRRIDHVVYVYLPVLRWGARGSQLVWALMLPLVALVSRYAVWVESFNPPVSSNLVGWVSRRPVIGVAQSLSAGVMAVSYGVRFPLRIERALLARYRDIVVLNDYDAATILRHCPRTSVHLIGNSVDAPNREVRDARDGTYALFLGRIDMKLKGLDLLLTAYQLGADDLLPLVIAGSGPDVRVLSHLIVDMSPRVTYVGRVGDVERSRLLDEAAFVVVPSRAESFSLVALEAMVHGRPVVHFDLPQLDWIPLECSVQVKAFDVAALCSALARYSGDVECRSAAGRNAELFAVQFNKGSADSYLSLVNSVIARTAT